MSEELTTANMLGIPISNFFSGMKADTDIYIGLASGKLVLLFRKGTIIDMNQIKNYAKFDIKELYVEKASYFNVLQKQVSVAGIIIDNNSIDNQKKISVLNRVAEGIYDAFGKKGFEAEAFDGAKTITESVVTLVNSKPALLNLFDSLKNIDDEIFKHSMAVSFMAPMLAKKLEWTRPDTLQKISLGGLLHDIGKKELPPELLKKPRSEMTYEDTRLYETHAYRGMEILTSLNTVPQDVISMVYEHHENSIGQGFPRRLWDMKIHPMARVIAITNVFCEMIMGSKNYPQAMTMDEAITHMEVVMGQPFNKQAFKALKELVAETK